MTRHRSLHNPKTTGRVLPLIVFLICSLLLFEPPFFAFNSASKRFQIVTFLGLPVVFFCAGGPGPKESALRGIFPGFLLL